jgi:hypothetical protein
MLLRIKPTSCSLTLSLKPFKILETFLLGSHESSDFTGLLLLHLRGNLILNPDKSREKNDSQVVNLVNGRG